jgi:hypothetical protein
MDIPVYLFTGFLESGKTKFIQETLEDPRFNAGERTLLLLCEEGMEEYTPDAFSASNIFIEIVDTQEALTAPNLQGLLKKHRAERVVVEYNGMWMLDLLYDALPKGWVVYQEFMFADASTFLSYNANMRALVVDKLKSCEMVVFNRFLPQMNEMDFHKIVRGVNSGTQIAYESPNGQVRYDDIEDPLPYDLNAPVVEISDESYAIWYRDMAENESRYDGKTVRFKGLLIKNKKLPENHVLVGRSVMTCCADDISFGGFDCLFSEEVPEGKHWMMVTAKITFEYSPLYKGTGPVLKNCTVQPTQKPQQEVATFY